MPPIPATHTAAIEALVEQDVARWGEQEREASRALHARLSFGRALNTLASRAEMAGDPSAPALYAAAEKHLTDSDWDALSEAG